VSTREDRIKGVLLGQAAGDALGAGYETGKPSHGRARMIGGGFGFEPGEWTDDTQQAVCVVLGRSKPQAVAGELLKWYHDNPKDIGSQTRAVMSRVKTPRGLPMASRAYARRAEARPRPRSWYPGTGNGSLMRTGPVCLPYLGDRAKIAEAARKVSDLTHADPWSGDACVLWSLAIDLAVRLGDKFIPEMVAGGLPWLTEERQKFWRDAIREALWLRPRRFRYGNGSAAGCFLAALSAVAHADGLEDGLQLAVDGGGDTDTVAAVAGALLGAWHGASAIPARWRKAMWGWPGMKTRDLERLALQAAAGAAA